MTLSGILNALDGVSSLNNTIVVLTTNCIENIDKALLREGRVDCMIELPKIRGEVVKDHLESVYEIKIPCELTDLAAKDVNSIKFTVKDDKKKLLSLLEDKYRKEG